MSIRHEHHGTVFVQVICDELDNVERKISLLEFLTRVQKQICEKSFMRSIDDAQTPQVHLFSHREVTICPAENLALRKDGLEHRYRTFY